MAAKKAATTAFHHCHLQRSVDIFVRFAVCVCVCIFHLNEQYPLAFRAFANRCIVVWPHIQSNLTFDYTFLFNIRTNTAREHENNEYSFVKCKISHE